MPAKDRRALTLNFGPDDFEDLAADAAASGFDTPSAYVSALIENRGQPLPPVLEKDSEARLNRYQGQIELLQNQLDKATQLNATGGLAGLADAGRVKEAPVMTQAQQRKAIEEGITAALDKKDAEATKKAHETLEKEHKELQKDFDKLEDAHLDLLKRSSAAERLDKALPGALGMLAKVAVDKFPQHAAGIAQSLAGFGVEGAAPAPQLGPPLPPELAELCREMSDTLNQQQLSTTVNIVNGLLDYPQLLPDVQKAVTAGARRCQAAATAAATAAPTGAMA